MSKFLQNLLDKSEWNVNGHPWRTVSVTYEEWELCGEELGTRTELNGVEFIHMRPPPEGDDWFMDFLPLNKEENVSRDEFFKHVEGSLEQRITWSTPIRWNYWKNGMGSELVGYIYEPYGDDPQTYTIIKPWKEENLYSALKKTNEKEKETEKRIGAT